VTKEAENASKEDVCEIVTKEIKISSKEDVPREVIKGKKKSPKEYMLAGDVVDKPKVSLEETMLEVVAIEDFEVVTTKG
jgi:hypothetical protein